MFHISVIIPTHNRASLLQNAIESVLKQTYPIHEILVVDDGSTDGTKDAVAKYEKGSAHAKTQVRYIFQRQQGVAVARNNGIATSTGDWIAFLDSDDLWLPEKLEWQVRALTEFAAVSAACATDSRYTNNPHLTKSAFEQIGAQCESQMGVFPEFARRITSHALSTCMRSGSANTREWILKSGRGFSSDCTIFTLDGPASSFLRAGLR